MKIKQMLIWMIAVWVILVLVGTGCQEEKKDEQTSGNTEIANPASVKCVEDGGELKIIDSPEGQSGMCYFPDGTVCEEWAYFRGECSKQE